jgi:PPOX class probable F420-dependent enzyme
VNAGTASGPARPRARRGAGPPPPAAVFAARMAARGAPHGARQIAEVAHRGSPDALARSKRALLVSFRRDGTPVATPVWAAERDGALYVRTERGSGKVRRLRNDARLLLAPCTARGKPLGAPLEATATVLADARERIAEEALKGRYGAGRALFEWTMDVMRVDMCYLELKPGAWPAGPLPA